MIVRELVARFGLDWDRRNFKQADHAVQMLKRGAMALAGGGVVMGLRRVVDEVTTLGDSVAKTSSKIGVGAAALQELRYAGERSGVAANTLDMALQRFARRTSEAAQGTGEAKDALAEMGIQLRDSGGRLRSADDLLGDVAEAFTHVEAQGDKVRLAFKLFDSEGVSMINMLGDGRAALDQLRERAQRLGGVMSEEFIEKAEAYRDSITDTRMVMLGLKIALTENLLPGLMELLQRTREGVIRFREWAEGTEIVRSAMLAMAGAAGVALTRWILMNAAAVTSMLALVAAAGVITLAIDDIWSTLEGGDSAGKRFMDWIDELKAGARAASPLVRTLAFAIDALAGKAIPALFLALTGDWTAAWDAAKGAVDSLWRSLKALGELPIWQMIPGVKFANWWAGAMTDLYHGQEARPDLNAMTPEAAHAWIQENGTHLQRERWARFPTSEWPTGSGPVESRAEVNVTVTGAEDPGTTARRVSEEVERKLNEHAFRLRWELGTAGAGKF